MEWGINKEGCRKRGERDMALLRLAAMRKSDFSKTWVGRQRLQEDKGFKKKYKNTEKNICKCTDCWSCNFVVYSYKR